MFAFINKMTKMNRCAINMALAISQNLGCNDSLMSMSMIMR